MRGLLHSEIISDPTDLDPEWTAWDALAVQESRPYCAPGWAMPWWSSAQPAGCQLRAITIKDDRSLVALAPFYVTRHRFGVTRWRLLADDASSYVEPLARQQLLKPAAAAIASALSRADRNVDVISLHAVPTTSPWPRLLCESWPKRPPRLSIVTTMRAPYVELTDGGYDGWLASRSRHFRQQMGRHRREFTRRGGTFRRAVSADDVAMGLKEFERLHGERWEGRGGSQALTAPIAQMLHHAGGLLDSARLQVWTAEVEGLAVASAVFVAAGTEMQYWLGGFDEKWSRCSPSLLLLIEAVRHAADAGYHRVSLGPGPNAYKYRLATGHDVLEWIDLLPHGKRYPYVRVCQSPYRAYRFASNRTPPAVKQRIRSAFLPPSVAPVPVGNRRQ